MSDTANRFFDLDVGGVITYRWRWDVVTPAGTSVLGQVTPEVAPTISNDSNAQVPRRVNGFRLYKSEAQDLNVITDRIRPTLILPDHSEWPAGVMVVASESRPITSTPILECDLYDETSFLDVETDEPFSLFVGGFPTTGLEEVLADAGLTEFSVAPDLTNAVPDPQGWEPGTARRRIANDLADLLGYWSPYQTNQGPVVCHGIDDTQIPSLFYTSGQSSRMVKDSIRDETSFIGAPNRYKVVSNGAVQAPIVGVYDIPDDFPHSFANTRRLIVDTHEAQGVATTAAAQRIARLRAGRDLGQRKRISFSSLVDLRHDTHSVMDFDGTFYRENAWTINTDTNVMTHEAQGMVTL